MSGLISDIIPFDIKKCDRVMTEGAMGKRPVTRVTGIFQRANVVNANGRMYPKGVLAKAIDNLQEAIKCRSVLGEFDHPCLTSNDFRVLTTTGWKEFKDIKAGDSVYSRIDGAMISSKVQKIIDEPYSGKAYRVQGRHMKSEFTPGHRFLLQTRYDKEEYVTIEEIFNNRKKFNKHIVPCKAMWEGKNQDFYVVPGIPKEELNVSINKFKNDVTDHLSINTKTFVSFLGLWLAEGSLTADNYGIIIHQKSDKYKQAIREMLAGFPAGLEWKENDGGYYVSDARLYKYLSQFGNKHEKFIPTDVKEFDVPYLSELVHWFQIGDGRLTCGRNNAFTTSYKLIRDLHECYVKSGGCCYFTTIITEEDYVFCEHLIKAENKKPLYQLTFSDTNGVYLDDRFLKIEEIKHDGRIYCLSVEHGNFYMEQNGTSFWTGNSDAKIHMDRASHLVTKVWMEGDVVYGECEILEDMPCGKMLKSLIDNKVRVSVSSRGVGDMESIKEGDKEYQKVMDGYSIVTWDSVHEPSVKGTELSVMESKNRMFDLRKQFEFELLEEIKDILKK